MGETKLKVSVLNLADATARVYGPIECIVDTGATLSTLPSKILESAKVQKRGRIKLTLADGRNIERHYGDAVLVLEDGNDIPTRVLFGENNDPALLGVVVLEIGGYIVDPIKGLIKKEYFHQY